MIDLHCHSTFSDGSLTPEQLMANARQRDMKALALTDHDTIAGWGPAAKAAEAVGVEFVPGVELSTLHNGRLLHVLGFYPDPPAVEALLKERLRSRQRRSLRILERLADLGMPLDVPDWGENEAPGRPHIAAFLVNKGYVKSKREAFDVWLGEDRPAYVPYEPYTASQGVADLRACGAVPVWAHPCSTGEADLAEVFAELLRAGLMGIEVHHPTHSQTHKVLLREMALEHGLVVTGGSDFHSPVVDDLDRIHGDLNAMRLPVEILWGLKAVAGVS